VSSTDDPPAESAAVQAFIAARQGELLAKAVATLEDCADDDLAAESHRLAGTLGTYQLTTAQVAMRNLESAVTATGIGKATSTMPAPLRLPRCVVSWRTIVLTPEATAAHDRDDPRHR
jgi:hypothetical protein